MGKDTASGVVILEKMGRGMGNKTEQVVYSIPNKIKMLLVIMTQSQQVDLLW